MANPSFRNRFGNPIVIGYFSKDELSPIDIDLSSLDMIGATADQQSYAIPFLDQHALDGFRIQLSQVRSCLDILKREWHIVLGISDIYVASFDSLAEARSYAREMYRYARVVIYRYDQVYETI